VSLEYQELLKIEQDLDRLSDHDVQRSILHVLREIYRLMRLDAITSATLGLQSNATGVEKKVFEYREAEKKKDSHQEPSVRERKQTKRED